jgi:hypothetical protein
LSVQSAGKSEDSDSTSTVLQSGPQLCSGQWWWRTKKSTCSWFFPINFSSSSFHHPSSSFRLILSKRLVPGRGSGRFGHSPVAARCSNSLSVMLSKIRLQRIHTSNSISPFRLTLLWRLRLELLIAGFADANHRGGSAFHDPKFALLHDCSLTHWAGRA